MEHNYIGIDPSFTRTGISIITKDRKLVFLTLSEKIGKKDFPNIYNSSKILSNKLGSILSEYDPCKVVMEFAPPVASMSPALFSLDTLYANTISDRLVELYHPMTLNKIIGLKKKSKSDSVFAGKVVVEELLSKGYSCSQKRISNDCYESLLYISYYMKQNNIWENL